MNCPLISVRGYRQALAALVAAIVSILAGCNQGPIGSYQGLEQRLVSYYEHEKQQDWTATYGFRTPLFRSTVPQKLYVETMGKENHGWDLVSVEVISATETEGKVVVSIKFVEKMPESAVPPVIAGASSKSAFPLEIERIDDSIWKKIDGEWYCYDAATRGRLSMNAALVSE